MSVYTDPVGHAVDQRYLLQQLEQRAAAEQAATENTGRSPR